MTERGGGGRLKEHFKEMIAFIEALDTLIQILALGARPVLLKPDFLLWWAGINTRRYHEEKKSAKKRLLFLSEGGRTLFQHYVLSNRQCGQLVPKSIAYLPVDSGTLLLEYNSHRNKQQQLKRLVWNELQHHELPTDVILTVLWPYVCPVFDLDVWKRPPPPASMEPPSMRQTCKDLSYDVMITLLLIIAALMLLQFVVIKGYE